MITMSRKLSSSLRLLAAAAAGRGGRTSSTTTSRSRWTTAMTSMAGKPQGEVPVVASKVHSASLSSVSFSTRAREGHRPWDNLVARNRALGTPSSSSSSSSTAFPRTTPPVPPSMMDPRYHHHPPGVWSDLGITGMTGESTAMGAAAAAMTVPTTSTATHTTEEGGHNYDHHDRPRTSVLMELTDRVGVLHDVLRYFWKFDVNVCRIESRPAKKTTTKAATPTTSSPSRAFDFFVDFEGGLDEPNVRELMAALRAVTAKLLVLDEKKVHWFPRHISELDRVANRILEAGTDLEADHPGFHDPVYRSRRSQLAVSAMNHRYDQPIPRIDYEPEEVAVWTAVWDQMQELWSQHACKEYLASLRLMKENCQYRRDNIPQQADINDYLLRRTGVRLRPVAGLLSSRDFLNGLAFRVFFCTQYIRHSSRPLYTPEPDICHELMGHVPMFADHDFADFSQEIGLASLGASDEDVDKLARCYWHSVEFGLCLENGVPKAYGAGLLSSFGELAYACRPDHPGAESPPTVVPWDPSVAAKTAFPITTYQPTYFCADSLQSAKDLMRDYCQELPRPFYATWNPQNCTIHIDRPVRRAEGTAPPTMATAQEDNTAFG